MPAIDYFHEILTTDRRMKELAKASRPAIGTLCNFPPDAVILAAGGTPVRLDSGDFAAASEAEERLPREVCPVCKSVAGILHREEGLHSEVAALVIPAVCDAKRKLPQTLGDTWPIFVMRLPASKTAPGAEEQWVREVERMAEWLEVKTGHKLTRDTLRAGVDVVNKRQRAFRDLLALRQPGNTRIKGTEVALVVAASFTDDIERWTKSVQTLIAERSAAPTLPEGPRLLITGAPLIYPNLRPLEIIESMGAQVVADSLCSGTDRLYNPIIPQEWNKQEMMRAAAESTLLPTTCPCFTESADRVNRILRLAEDYGVQGVIYHNLRLCALYQFETTPVRTALQAEGIPMLELQTDYSAEDTEQLRTRLQAFLEIVSGPDA